jgi:hypothetical protein
MGRLLVLVPLILTASLGDCVTDCVIDWETDWVTVWRLRFPSPTQPLILIPYHMHMYLRWKLSVPGTSTGSAANQRQAPCAHGEAAPNGLAS